MLSGLSVIPGPLVPPINLVLVVAFTLLIAGIVGKFVDRGNITRILVRFAIGAVAPFNQPIINYEHLFAPAGMRTGVRLRMEPARNSRNFYKHAGQGA